MRRPLFALAAAGIALSPLGGGPAAIAQERAERPSVDGRKLVAEIRRLLDANYVLPEVRPEFDAMLAKGLSSGRYDIADRDALVERINADLHGVTPDKHLHVMFDPERSRRLSAAPPGAGLDDAPPSAEAIAAAERRNHGLAQMRILPGNIRYLETDGFLWAGKPSERAYDDAMRFLAGGDAVIIDMRRNGGGSPDAVRYLVSHFMEPDRPLMTFYMGSRGTDTSATLRSLRAPRMVGKPLYVLTSGGSASAAEEFIGHVAGYKLGEIIGENSAGAGFRNEFYPLPDGMVISISVGRAVLASTGKDWEGVGIKPTTQVSVDKALEVAEVHALRRLASTAGAPGKFELEAVATLLAAQVDPVKTALPLTAYAGTFGERTVAVEGSKLAYRRAEGPKFTLVAVGTNEFAFEDDPTTRVQFAVTGASATAFDLVHPDGSRTTAARTR
jgi:hypothetical protein